MDIYLTKEELLELDVDDSPVKKVIIAINYILSKGDNEKTKEYLERSIFKKHNELLMEVILENPEIYRYLSKKQRMDMDTIEPLIKGLRKQGNSVAWLDRNASLLPFDEFWKHNFDEMYELNGKYPELMLFAPDKVSENIDEVKHAIATIPEIIQSLRFDSKPCASIKDFTLLALESAKDTYSAFHNIYVQLGGDLSYDFDVIKVRLRNVNSNDMDELLGYAFNAYKDDHDDELAYMEMLNKPEIASILFDRNPYILNQIDGIWNIFEDDMENQEQSAIAVRSGEQPLPSAYEFFCKPFHCPNIIRKRIASHLTKDETLKLLMKCKEFDENGNIKNEVIASLNERMDDIQKEEVFSISSENKASNEKENNEKKVEDMQSIVDIINNKLDDFQREKVFSVGQNKQSTKKTSKRKMVSH